MTIDEVCKQIFYYIDTYYDENKADIVKELIESYVLSLKNTESSNKGNNDS
jgi:hypothetical protein